jgi:hypothetical protein
MRTYLLTALTVVACLSGVAAEARSGGAPAPLVARPIGLSNTTLRQHGGLRNASLMLYTADDPNVAWLGQGSATKTVALCVASTTGHYRLLVSSRRGGAARGLVRIPYTITFTDGVGAQQTASTKNSTTLMFDGSAPSGANCLNGPNATLAIEMDEQSLLSGVAGDYADNLRFAVETR